MAIRKVFRLGDRHGDERYFTLPQTWLRWLEESELLVPKSVVFKMQEHTLTITPFEGQSVEEMKGLPHTQVMTTGGSFRIIQLPRVWCMGCDRFLSDEEKERNLRYVWVLASGKTITLEPASKEDHDARQRSAKLKQK